MVTFTNLTAQNDTVDRTAYTTASISPTGDRLVLLTINAFRNTGSAQPVLSSVSGGGMTTWTLVHTQDVDVAGADRATMWVYRAMQASPGSGAVSIVISGANLSACSWAICQSSSDVDTSGTNGSGAIVSANIVGGTASGAGTTAGPVNYAQAIASGNCCWSAVGWQAAAGYTPQTGWTELADVGGGNCGLGTAYVNDDTETDVSATIPSSRWGIVGLEIQAPSGTSASFPTTSQTTTAQALTGAKSATAATVPQFAAAQALTAAKAGASPSASETATAQSVTGTKTAALPTVSDTTGPVAPAGSKLASLIPATETDQAQGSNGSLIGALPLAAETDVAQALTHSTATALPTVTYSDTAQTLTGGKTVQLPTAALTEAPVALAGIKTEVLVFASETTVAQPFTVSVAESAVIVGDLTGPLRRQRQMAGPGPRRIASGTATRRRAVGTSATVAAATGPACASIAATGPANARASTGPATSRTVTGSET